MGRANYVVKPIGMARVMEDYAMQGPDELSLHRGSIVTIYERYEDGWMKGEINGKIGRFPAEVFMRDGAIDSVLYKAYGSSVI